MIDSNTPMKTESEKIEISKQVAEIVGIEPKGKEYVDFFGHRHSDWLVDDHGACAEIAADRRISTNQNPFLFIEATWDFQRASVSSRVADFPSRIEATSWAICEAVIAQHKESGNANSAS